MSESSDVPLLAAPDAPAPVQDDAGADRDDSAQDDRAEANQGERAADPAMPEAVANNYRFAGLVTLIPEDAASVDRRA